MAEIDENGKGALAFGATKPKDYTAPSESLIQDYLRTGTYHSVLFVFAPLLRWRDGLIFTSHFVSSRGKVPLSVSWLITIKRKRVCKTEII